MGDSKKSESLLRQIMQYKEQRRREDRRLARHVAQWVETAMEISAAGGGLISQDAAIAEDI